MYMFEVLQMQLAALNRAPLGSGELHILLGGGISPLCDLRNY